MLEFGRTLRDRALRALLPIVLTSSAAFAVAQTARAAPSVGPETASPARRVRADPTASPEHRYFYLFGNDARELLLVDMLRPESRELFMASFPPDADPGSRGAPRLVIGSAVLVKDIAIPARLPVLAREGLRRGGIDWPPITGLAAMPRVARLAPGTLAHGAGLAVRVMATLDALHAVGARP